MSILTRKFFPEGFLKPVALIAFLALSACQDGTNSLFPKEDRPLPPKLVKAMKAKGMTARSPILVRIFKEESALEVWKRTDTGRYAKLETYEICKWSGKLGPKFKEGDRQAPEGFYTVAPAQMNPKSSYYLSFNMGYPNKFDRSLGRTGTNLMVHGACSSAGCYSMTDDRVAQIYALARDSFKGGQRAFQIQAFPFRMTPENMVLHADNVNYEFWKTLKKGSDYFEITKTPPKVDVCEKNYVFNRQVEKGVRFRSTAACPPSTISPRLEQAYLEKSRADNAKMEKIREKLANKERLKNLLQGNKIAGSKPGAQPIDNSQIASTVATNAPLSNAPIPAAAIPQPRPTLKK